MDEDRTQLMGLSVWVRPTRDGAKRRGSVLNTRWVSGESGRELVIIVRGGAITSVLQSAQGTLWDFE